MTPVMIPARAVGSTTRRITFHSGSPSASAASRNELGTSRIISSVVRSTIGNMITASAMPPAKAEKCCRGRTTTAYAKMPMTIDGTPFSRSARNLTTHGMRRSVDSAR